MNFEAFSCLTFDCYGTLIDWESGILGAMRPILDAHGVAIDDEDALEVFGRAESAAESGTYRPYRQVLSDVVRGFGEALGFEPSEEERSSLANSIGDWAPFEDTVDALMALRGRYRLAIISNIDDDLFAKSAPKLGVDFDEIVTAQQVGAYKPSLQNFSMAFERLGHDPSAVLHVAQSLHHDIAPARELGLACVWVNRRAGRRGTGATAPATARPDLEVPDLQTLVKLMGLAQSA